MILCDSSFGRTAKKSTWQVVGKYTCTKKDNCSEPHSSNKCCRVSVFSLSHKLENLPFVDSNQSLKSIASDYKIQMISQAWLEHVITWKDTGSERSDNL